MTTEFKFGPNQERWLKLLESGSRKQAREVLHKTNGGYCCLGIGELALGLKPKDIAHDQDGDDRTDLSEESRLALGLRSCSGGHREDNTLALANLNDDRRWSFKKIAAWIREHPTDYFKASK